MLHIRSASLDRADSFGRKLPGADVTLRCDTQNVHGFENKDGSRVEFLLHRLSNHHHPNIEFFLHRVSKHRIPIM